MNTRKHSELPGLYISQGKIQPQATELEEAVLGALMYEKNIIILVADMLTPEMFYRESHVIIYKSIKELFKKDQPIDVLSVTAALRKTGELDLVGGAYYVTQLTNKPASYRNIEHYAKLIIECFVKRELIRVSAETQREAFEEGSDAFDLLNKTESSIINIQEGNITIKEKHIRETIDDVDKAYNEASKVVSGIYGGKTGIYQLDSIIRGFKPEQNIVVAGRPAMGKTALGLQIVKVNAIEQETPIALFSLEMSRVQCATRLIASLAQIDFERLQSGKLLSDEYERYIQAKERIRNAPIYIDDTPGLTNTEFMVRCKRLRNKYGITGVVADYIQLRGSETEKELRHIIVETTRTDKRIAKENGLYVVDLSQIGRSAEKNHNKRPMLSDLKESGSVEEDADIVVMLYRPEYYGIKEDSEGSSTENKVEFIVGKNRNGYTGSTWGYWYGDTQSFHSISKSEISFTDIRDPDDSMPF